MTRLTLSKCGCLATSCALVTSSVVGGTEGGTAIMGSSAEKVAARRSSRWFVGSSSTFVLPFPLTGARPLLELRGQLLVGRERSLHGADETPDLLSERALPRVQ